jgi:hypothetical protein
MFKCLLSIGILSSVVLAGVGSAYATPDGSGRVTNPETGRQYDFPRSTDPDAPVRIRDTKPGRVIITVPSRLDYQLGDSQFESDGGIRLELPRTTNGSMRRRDAEYEVYRSGERNMGSYTPPRPIQIRHGDD